MTYSQRPSRLQNLSEFIIESFLGLTKSTAGSYQKTRAFFPFIATIFLFIILSNWSGLIPGVGVIGINEPAEIESVKIEPSDNNTVLLETQVEEYPAGHESAATTVYEDVVIQPGEMIPQPETSNSCTAHESDATDRRAASIKVVG